MLTHRPTCDILLTLYRLDIKNIFTDGLSKILAKLRKTFYTTTMPLARELSVVFTTGIVREPPLQPELDVHNSSSPKKLAVDIKERRKLAKRIIKAIQPQFETALRAEADISGIDFEVELEKLEHLWEACLEAEVGLYKDGEGDIAMTEPKPNGVGYTNGDSGAEDLNGDDQNGEAIDVEMEDVDAPYDEDDIVVDVSTSYSANVKDDGDTITAALTEVNGNKAPFKVNGLKGADTNGHFRSTENGQFGSQVSPEPVINDNPATDNSLIEGGVPQFLRGYFNIDGTNITEIAIDEPDPSEELSEMDDEQVNQLVADTAKPIIEAAPVPAATKSKKAKSKRRR
jgi:NuA3 HAT complex component NTO1